MSLLFGALNLARDVAGWAAWIGIGLAPLAIAALVILYVPPARKLAIVAALLWGSNFLTATWFDLRGAARVQAEWDAANARAEADRLARDREIKAATVAEVEPQIAVQRQRIEDLEQKAREYEDDLKTRAVAACRRAPGDLERLRALDPKRRR